MPLAAQRDELAGSAERLGASAISAGEDATAAVAMGVDGESADSTPLAGQGVAGAGEDPRATGDTAGGASVTEAGASGPGGIGDKSSTPTG
eukprot:3744347-Alexandrium_andersonii.AAC.1